MNKILFSAVLLILLMGSCKKSGFDYQLYKPAIGDIDSIYLSATDKMMVADGQATLQFIVEGYRKVHLSSGRDSMMIIDIKQLPAGSLKIIEEKSGQQVGLTYSTNVLSTDTVKFHAEIGTKRSATKPVALRAKPAKPDVLYIDVVFHVWELNTTHPTYDPSSYQAITYPQLQEAVRYMNEILSNKLSRAPNGAEAGVVFRLAPRNQNGATLTQPGFDRQVYGDNIKVNPSATIFSQNDFITFINNNKASLIWNPKNFLNVHVMPFGSNNSMGNVQPAKQLAPQPEQTAIPGIAGIAADENDFVLDYANATIGIARTIFFPGYERKIEIFSAIGPFYGLFTPTLNASRQYNDFCYDTRDYDVRDPRNSGLSSSIRVGLDNEKYYADNIMDDTRYPTAGNSITIDQIARMRAVMTRCPGRMNAKNQ